MDSVRVTAADFNGRDWDGSPFDPAPAPTWLMSAIECGDITVSAGHSTDYAVWAVFGAGEAWPGDTIVKTGDRAYSIERRSDKAATDKGNDHE